MSTKNHAGRVKTRRQLRPQSKKEARKQRQQARNADLARSGLDGSDARKAGLRTISGAAALQKLGFGNWKVNLPDCTKIPYFDIDGTENPDFFRVRVHSNYEIRDRNTGTHRAGPKYWQPRGTSPRIYFPPTVKWRDVGGTVVVVEGEKKALTLCKAGIPAVAIGGAWNWKASDSDALIPDFEKLFGITESIAVCFDSDVQTNPNVRQALCRFCTALEDAGFEVEVIELPAGPDEKIGADDFLVRKGRRENGSVNWNSSRKAFQDLSRRAPPEPEEIELTRADAVETEPVRPIAPFLFRKKVTIGVGDPGLGKSIASCDFAARITTGRDWPGGVRAFDGPSNVVMLTGEDDLEDTVVPRLQAAGADLSRVILLNDSVRNERGESVSIALDSHMSKIHKIMVDHNASLLVIDPVSAFMGKADSHRNSSVRAFLGIVRRYAKVGNYAVFLITHFSKPGERRTSAGYRVMGSIGFSAAPRAVYGFIQDPDDPKMRLMLPIKSNLGDDSTGYRYRIATNKSLGLRPPPPYVDWCDDNVSDQRIDDLLDPPTPREAAKLEKEAEIREWLDGYLEPGYEILSEDFNEDFAAQGFDPKKVRDIAAKLGYRKSQNGVKHGPWYTYRIESG